VAGVSAAATAIVGMRRARRRELDASKEIASIFQASGLGVSTIYKSPVKMHVLWSIVLAAFAIADFLAYLL
jgi:hypothetical protein